MSKLAYLVNSTPKYYGLLPLHFTLLKRYATNLQFTMFLATEIPDHTICTDLQKMGVQLIPILPEESGFLESRRAALRVLYDIGYHHVLPMQEDFLLEGCIMIDEVNEAVTMLDLYTDLASVRLMPSPGPVQQTTDKWASLVKGLDSYGFTFQATLWQTWDCLQFYSMVCEMLEQQFPKATTAPEKRRHAEIRSNMAENVIGQGFFWNLEKRHLAWKRAGPWSNAGYLCPWPYRPTAIVQGVLEPWAIELGKREGVPISFQ